MVAVLNDLFGIQSRGGCSCAGPYGHRLLAIDAPKSHAFRDEIVGHRCEGIKPGWTRINFHYFLSDTVRDYLIDTVDLLADHGHRLLPDYHFAPRTGLWRHRDAAAGPPLRLTDAAYNEHGHLHWPHAHARMGEETLAGQLAEARTLLDGRPDRTGSGPSALLTDFEALRWFPLPPQRLAP